MTTDKTTQGLSGFTIAFYLHGSVLIISGILLMILLILIEPDNLTGPAYGMILIFIGVLVIYIGKQSPPDVPAPHRIPPPCPECGRTLTWHKDPAGYYCFGCREYKDQCQDPDYHI